ncbi:putative F-box protein At1g49610 [Syzygium oleosum]|uniref:putative F-box protein At1g49610 n=1 Tax=Syzygium oleosum TaxID=219896 RepID=UPI0011D1AF97|nr:putative F-box protein At1g49610 [Syzygium oleosum]
MPRRSSGVLPSRTEGNRPPPPPLSFPRDHINALPDHVITGIFSYLPFKDVVKTSALSRRWRYAWATATPHLEFDGFWHRNREASPSGFPSLVDSVLRQCTSPAVKKFHISHFKYNMANRPKLDHWLRAAEERRVEDLRVWLITSLRSPYVLPQFLFCSNWLVRLEVSLCCFPLGTAIMWPRLNVLSMVQVKLSDDILERIFRGSPVLESLELRGCWGMKNIVIDSTSVKDLLLIGGSFSALEKIRAPHLLSLCVSGTWYPLEGQEGISLDDASSLVEAKLDFVLPTVVTDDTAMCRDLLKELLEKLRGVPTITIGGWCLQVLSHLEMEGVPYPLSKCQNLILYAPVSQWDLPGIAYILQSSQCLEKLVIHLTNLPRSKFELDEESDGESEDCVNFNEEELLCLRKGNFECLAKHLKRVEIIVIGADRFGSNRLLTLIKFFLGDAPVLEKLVIKVKLPTPIVPWELLGVRKNVNSFRKASENAEVNFDWGPHISI